MKPVVVFGSETWAVAEMDMERLGTGERTILRRVSGPVVEGGIERIGTNQELRELYKDRDIADVKEKRLELTGHVRSKNGSGKDS